ncbi:ferric reductase, putative [Phytophthora infestans T30-4]|uniref:Ferric reductase, putative n=1 Tax=Phytophthora infestans (strain T30-4) TaxID=403677 RepID=D0N0V0_PHYIT|nr:ferric reductase, putative [Phytophthora infestans T30-4]EEY67263.1 ferric reductase, putative [Phytophthora infestans T30-4]|eukprot:XP_002905911.1 ferric reductase, putative [Phytophthora infestans T30-4]
MRNNSKRKSRAVVDAPVSPKSSINYVPVLDGIDASALSWSSHAHTSQVPILDVEDGGSATYNLDGSVHTVAATEEFEPPPHRPLPPGPLQRLLRSWMVLRWKLSRKIFSTTVPVLTSVANLKLGDVLITFPIVAGAIAYTVLQAKTNDVPGTGTPSSIALAVVFGFAVRNNSILLIVTGIPFERALFYHKLAAFATIIIASLHGFTHLSRDEQRFSNVQVISGSGAFIALVSMSLLSLSCIRRRFFEFFLRVHWVLFIAVITCAIIHGAVYVMVGVAPWAIDMVYRLAYRSRIYAHGSVRSANKGVIARNQLSICALPGNITRVQFPRVRQDTGETFAYEPGQYAFLCIPSISYFQWHPFTIASSPHEAMVTFYIKAVGDWTTKLLTVALKREASAMRLDGPSTFDLLVDGPYGKLALDLSTPTVYSHVVLLAGGIGMTPMRSIVNWLHHECYYRSRGVIPHVRFIWSVKEKETISSLLARDERRRDSCLEVDEVASYFPHILSHPRNTNQPTDAFVSEVYLTRDILDDEAQDLPELSNCLHIGARPDAIAILREMGEEAKNSGKDRVAVLVCGPSALIDDVHYASTRLARELKVHFDVHREVFEL